MIFGCVDHGLFWSSACGERVRRVGRFSGVREPYKLLRIFVQVLPYLWRLASSDKTLRWRLAVALILLVASKVSFYLQCSGTIIVSFCRCLDLMSEFYLNPMLVECNCGAVVQISICL